MDFDAGRSGGVGYEWTFSDGATATGERVTHTYPDDGPVTATLTVIYADGERVSKTIALEIPPLPNAEEGVDIVATVPLTLGLKLGAPAAFAPMIPGVTATYTASTTATVISTAGSAQLTSPTATRPRRAAWSMAAAVMPQALRARAGTAAYAAVSGTPLTLVSWATPIPTPYSRWASSNPSRPPTRSAPASTRRP